VAFESVDELLLDEADTALWELFHENSKLSRHERHPTYAVHPSDATVVRMMHRLRRVKPYTDYPKVALPTAVPTSEQSFDDVLLERTTARSFGPGSISLPQLAKVLFMSYAVTRDNEGSDFPRPFRIIPSGGALYPLELYVHASRVEDLQAGLYHYDAEKHSLDALRAGDASAEVAAALVQHELARTAAATVFVSAVFFRSTFKYGDRGYRFVLLEAGHLVQNALLCAQELGLAAAPIGGYSDRDVDRFLGFDGLTESTVYVVLVGPVAPEHTSNGGGPPS
jgi:SagB-type dehydrogenase family enzyme